MSGSKMAAIAVGSFFAGWMADEYYLKRKGRTAYAVSNNDYQSGTGIYTTRPNKSIGEEIGDKVDDVKGKMASKAMGVAYDKGNSFI